MLRAFFSSLPLALFFRKKGGDWNTVKMSRETLEFFQTLI